MSVVTHVSMLETKHHKLDDAIIREARRPMPDFAYVTLLKKQKLLIKEELQRLNQILGVRELAEPSSA